MDHSLHNFRDDGSNIICDDDIRAHIYIGFSIIDHDQVRDVIEGLDW